MRISMTACAATLALASGAASAEPSTADEPKEVQQVSASASSNTAFAQDLGPAHLELTGLARMTAYGRTDFALDRDGTRADRDGTLLPQVRFGARLDSRGLGIPWIFGGELELDAATGTLGAATMPEGAGFAGEGGLDYQLRKAYGFVAYKRVVQVGAGAMTSNWGLGLIANDGTRRFTPGSARFTDPRGGDRVLRAFARVGLSEALGAGLVVGGDVKVEDDITLARDDARQAIAALVLGVGKPTSGGIYAAYRDQESDDGTDLQALAVDVHAKSRMTLPRSTVLQLEGEAVYIDGVTTYAPTMDFPEHDVRQFAAAGRVNYGLSWVGGVLDVVYASGDRNFDDVEQNAFKADPNYELGMLMFRQVLANQTARAVGTAGDLELVGRPSADIDRYPTRGSVSNTIAAFPRAWYRIVDGLELYGGALVAWTAVDSADPLNSRIAGGAPMNAMGGDPGRYLGTEVDLGLRYALGLFGGTLAVGLESAAFAPGSAFRDDMGRPLDTVYGARSFVSFEFDGGAQ